MNKRLSLLIIAMLCYTATLWARPAYGKPVDIIQPDGTTLTLLLHGDEYLSYTTTTDGYTVLKADNGYYYYAQTVDGQLQPTTIVARNSQQRSSEEQAFLTTQGKHLKPQMTAAQQALKEQAASMIRSRELNSGSNTRRVTPIFTPIDYTKFKGLVVLVQWNDRNFTMDNPQAFYQTLTSQKNLTDSSLAHYPVPVTGSVRDYFYDNSMGIFEPTFDVVGPVTIDYSCTYPNPKGDDNYSSRIINMIRAIMSKANQMVDFNNYDLNNDGVIDMVYFVFAGYGSYVAGNDSKYIWPHASDLSYASYYYNLKYDNKRFGRYACSTEIQDLESEASDHVWLDGIGTMCHEFSHVLGLADHYDTDYEENGTAPTPDFWDLMANGADFNYGLTPVGYSAFERHVLGFCQPTIITEEGQYQLEAFDKGNQSFLVTSSQKDEDFYIENRQLQGWDTYLPHHGMLVWRVNSSNASVWKNNKVNISPDDTNLELLIASGSSSNSGYTPFPGYDNVIDLTSSTNSTWGNKGATINLYNIKEENGTITFEAGEDLYPYVTEDFETTPLAESGATGLAGRFCTWDISNVAITGITDGYGSGEHLATFSKSATLTSSILERNLRFLKFTVKNSSKSAINFYIRTSTDGTNWTLLRNAKNETVTQLKKSASAAIAYNDIPAGNKFQFVCTSSATSATCYLDNIVVSLDKADETAIQPIQEATVTADGNTYNMAGQRVGNSHKGLVIKNGRKYFNQ